MPNVSRFYRHQQMASTVSRRPSDSLTGDILVPLALFVLGMWLCRHALGGAFPEGDDVPYHLSRSVFGYHEIFAKGHLDGWSPNFGAGSENFLLYGPGVSIVFAAIKVLTFNSLSDIPAFALVMCLAYASIGPAAWFMARSLHLGRRAAGLTGIAAMMVSISFSIGLAGIFDLGLVANGVAAPLFCLGVGFLARTLFDRRLSDRVGLAVTSAAMLITHLPTAEAFALTAVIIVAFAAPRLEHIAALARDLAATAALTVGLAAFWLLPLAVHHGPRQPLADWGTPPWGQRLEELASGRFALTYWPALLVMLGFTGLLLQPWQGSSRSWRTRMGAGLFAAGPLLMAVSYLLRSRFPDVVALNILPNRTSGYVVLLMILPAAQGWARLWEVCTKPLRRVLGELDPLHLLGAVPIAVALVAVLVRPELITARDLATNRAVVPEGVASLATALHNDMAPQSRFAFAQDDAFRTSFAIPHPEMWIAYFAHRDTVADLGGNSVSSFDNFIVDHIWDTPWTSVAPRLARAGVTHLIVAPQRRGEMRTHLDYTEVYSDTFAAIYRRVGEPGEPAPAALITSDEPADITLRQAEPESYRWTKTSTTAVDVTLAIGYFEKWTARFDGRSITPRRSDDGLLSLRLPAGEGTLAVTYERGPDDWFGALITAGVLIAMTVVGMRRAWCGRSALLDDDGVDGDVGDGTIATSGLDALDGVEDIKAGDELAEK